MILYKKHLVKYFCHLALAHVQYNLYDNVFAFLCPISSLSPFSLLQRSGLEAYPSNQCDLGGGAGEGASPCLPAPVAVSPSSISISSPSSQAFPLPAENLDLSVGGEMGGEARQPLPTVTLALVVIFRQKFVVFFPFYGRF